MGPGSGRPEMQSSEQQQLFMIWYNLINLLYFLKKREIVLYYLNLVPLAIIYLPAIPRSRIRSSLSAYIIQFALKSASEVQTGHGPRYLQEDLFLMTCPQMSQGLFVSFLSNFMS